MKKRNQLTKTQNFLNLYINNLDKLNFHYFYYYNFFFFYVNADNLNLYFKFNNKILIQNYFKILKINQLLDLQSFIFIKNYYKLVQNNILFFFFKKNEFF